MRQQTGDAMTLRNTAPYAALPLSGPSTVTLAQWSTRRVGCNSRLLVPSSPARPIQAAFAPAWRGTRCPIFAWIVRLLGGDLSP